MIEYSQPPQILSATREQRQEARERERDRRLTDGWGVGKVLGCWVQIHDMNSPVTILAVILNRLAVSGLAAACWSHYQLCVLHGCKDTAVFPKEGGGERS